MPIEDALCTRLWYYKNEVLLQGYLAKCWLYGGYSVKVMCPPFKPPGSDGPFSREEFLRPFSGVSQTWIICRLASFPVSLHHPLEFLPQGSWD